MQKVGGLQVTTKLGYIATCNLFKLYSAKDAYGDVP